ncbi:uncharacterized protein LOC123261771 isoform X2 [Cotesia glomerata]|uniref:uncharacterized protein LOC123261771 isoform X2 n=1 Tax=Cotesia glomerata TaxID=32391 RepID=UPI001D001D30|nr:uncharacterized protein LOC123261771 isoform X2 [Cotesia glomerata]
MTSTCDLRQEESSSVVIKSDLGRATRMARLKFLVGLNATDDDDTPKDNINHERDNLPNVNKQLESIGTYSNVNSSDGDTNKVTNDYDDVLVKDYHGEVLYQNNVEALNSFSQLCTQSLDTAPSSCSVTCPNSPTKSSNSSSTIDTTTVMSSCEGVRRRHSTSVEITALTNVKTGPDGMPVISFSFLHTDDVDPGVSDNNINKKDNLNFHGSCDVYDFPKTRGLGGYDSIGKSEQGLYEDFVNTSTRKSLDLDSLYDFPKTRRLSVRRIKLMRNKDFKMGGDEDNDDRVYEIPRSKDDLDLKKDKYLTDSQKKSFQSLNIEIMETAVVPIPITAEGSYSDPECPKESLKSLEKRRKHRRLGKAWTRMRSWLRDEKLKLGEVVQRHAKLQAIGVIRAKQSEDDDDNDINSNISKGKGGNRCGFYDLVAARNREFGSVVEEQEEGQVASIATVSHTHDIKRPDCEYGGDHVEDEDHVDENSHDLQTRKALECCQVEKVKTTGKPEMMSGKLRKRIASSENVSRIKLKLTPVSFSLDKLCNDDDDNNNINHNNNNNINNDNDEDDNDDDGGNRRKDDCGDGDQGLKKRHRFEDKELRSHVGKGGLIKRRMLGSIRGLMASTHLLHQHDTEETGPGGFEDIRRYVKQGGDFCKELAAILHERAELEASYAKGLSKLSSKLTKACSKDQGGNSSGGVNEAWRNVGEEMEAAAEAHRAWGIALSEQLAKPLRVGVAEAQGRSRKAIESSVDKASKSLQEWRGVAAKSKKQSFACARENERLQDLARIQSISQSQQNNNKTSSHHMTEKEVNKLENRRRKAEDSSRRADTEFYTVSVRAERARLEYESTVRKGAKQMELLEEERLSALKDLANVYLAHFQALAPRLQQSADRLATPVRNCSVAQDIDILRNLIRRMDSNDASSVDQLLPDFYAEHVTLAMNRERRKQALVRVMHLIRQDLERERRGREGLETLHRAFIQTPAFAADESTQNVTDKLHHMRSMLTYLEAARYKVAGALVEVEGGKRGKHPLAEHILVSRDKQGLQQSVLKIPAWAKNEVFQFPDVDEDLVDDIHLTKDAENERHQWIDRTAGDGNSENPPDEEDFSDFDEFSSQSEDNNNQDVDVSDMGDNKHDQLEQCRAIYQYAANLNDELSLTPGDLITIHEKQPDGWWIGECAGRTGIFPATYVQVIR